MTAKRNPHAIYFDEPSLTKQAFKNECDINVIMKRYRNVHGVDPLKYMPAASGGLYGDFTQIVDYRTALHRVHAADEAFMALPSNVRKRFRNDVQELLDFVDDPQNLEEMRSLGLAKPVVQPAPETAVTA